MPQNKCLCSKIFQWTWSRRAYPAYLEGFLPSWCPVVTGLLCHQCNGCNKAEHQLAASGGAANCDFSTGRESEDLCHRTCSHPSSQKRGEPFRTDKWRFGRQSSFLNKFQSIRISGNWPCSFGGAGNLNMERQAGWMLLKWANCHIRGKFLTTLAIGEELSLSLPHSAPCPKLRVDICMCKRGHPLWAEFTLLTQAGTNTFR